MMQNNPTKNTPEKSPMAPMATTHNLGAKVLLKKVHNPVGKVAIHKNILSMNLVKRLAESDEFSIYSLSDVIAEYAAMFVSKSLLGGTALPLSVCAAVGEYTEPENYEKAFSARLSKIASSGLPDDFKEELLLNQIELMQSCFLPFFCNKTYELESTVKEWGRNTASNALKMLGENFTHQEIWQSILASNMPAAVREAYSETPFTQETLSVALSITELYKEIGTAISQLPQLTKQSHSQEKEADASQQINFETVNLFQLFKNQLESVKSQLGKIFIDLTDCSQKAAQAETTVNDFLGEYQTVNKLFNENKKALNEIKINTWSPQLARLGALIAESIFRLNQINQAGEKFISDKLKTIENIEATLKKTGLELNKSRIGEYLAPSITTYMSIPDLRSHVNHLMAEDMVCMMLQREQNYQEIKREIIVIEQKIKQFSKFKWNVNNQLGSIIYHQTIIKDKINNVAINKLPGVIQAGIPLLTHLTAAIQPAASLFLTSVSYLLNNHSQKQETAAQNKINTYVKLFQQEQCAVESLKNNLYEIDCNLQNYHAQKSQLNWDLLQNAGGIELLKSLKSLYEDLSEQQKSNQDNLKKLTKQRNRLNKLRKQLAHSEKKDKPAIQAELDEVIAQLSSNRLQIEAIHSNNQNTNESLEKLNNLYEKQQKIAPIYQWFEEYCAHFYREKDKEKLHNLLQWRQAVKEKLYQAELLHSENDTAITHLSHEITQLIAPFQALGLRKTSKVLEITSHGAHFGYNLFRTVNDYIDALSLINASRHTIDENNVVISSISFLSACKKMGLSFNISRFFTPLLTSVNLGLRLIDTIFGFNLYKNPIEEQIKQSSNQFKEQLTQIAEKIKQLTEQSNTSSIEVKMHLNAVQIKQFEHHNSTLTLQEQFLNDKKIKIKKEKEKEVKELIEKYDKINKQLYRINQSINSEFIDIYQDNLLNANYACDPRFSHLLLGEGAIVVTPFDSINYLAHELAKFDQTVQALVKNKIPNYRLMYFILENVNYLLQENKHTENNEKINDILKLADNLYQLLESIRHNSSWIKKITTSVLDDIKKLQEKINQFNPDQPIMDLYHVNDKALLDLNRNKAIFDLHTREKIWLDKLTKKDYDFKLYYFPNYKKKMPPKGINKKGIMITQMISDPVKPSVKLRYVDNGEFLLIDWSSENKIFDEINLITRSEESLLKDFIKSKKHEIQTEMNDQVLLPFIDRIEPPTDFQFLDCYVKSYVYLLKILLRELIKNNVMKPSFQWKNYENYFMTFFPIHSTHYLRIKNFQQIPSVLVFHKQNDLMPLLLPQRLIDNLSNRPENKGLSDIDKFGLGYTDIHYSFEKQGRFYAFSLLYLAKINSITCYNTHTILYEFDCETVEQDHSPSTFLMKVLYSNFKSCSSQLFLNLNLYQFSATHPNLGFRYDGSKISYQICEELQLFSLGGSLTNTLLPFLNTSLTTSKSVDWLPINTLVYREREARYQRIKNFFELVNKDHETCEEVISKILKNYELLIAGVRLENLDYVSAVGLVEEHLQLPHPNKIVYLFENNIDTLKQYLQKIASSKKVIKTEELVNKINYLTNDQNSIQNKLHLLLNSIREKLDRKPAALFKTDLSSPFKELYHREEISSIMAFHKKLECGYLQTTSSWEKALFQEHEVSQSNNIISQFSKKIIGFTNQNYNDHEHHYNLVDIFKNFNTIQRQYASIKIVFDFCMRSEIKLAVTKNLPKVTHSGFLFLVVLNQFHWSLLALYRDGSQNSTQILWKDSCTGNQLESEENLELYRYIFTTFKNCKLTTSSAVISILRNNIQHSGPIVIQEIYDIIETYKNQNNKNLFSLENINFTITDGLDPKKIMLTRIKQRGGYSNNDEVIKLTKPINEAISALVSKNSNDIFSMPFELLQVFLDNLIQLLWHGESYDDISTFKRAHENTLRKQPVTKPSLSLTADKIQLIKALKSYHIYPTFIPEDSNSQFKAVAKWLAAFDQKTYYQLAPLSQFAFFKNPQIHWGKVQEVLRTKTVEFMKNNASLFKNNSNDYLRKMSESNTPGDENTLLALSYLLNRSIVVIKDSLLQNLDVYSSNFDDKNYIILIRYSSGHFDPVCSEPSEILLSKLRADSNGYHVAS